MLHAARGQFAEPCALDVDPWASWGSRAKDNRDLCVQGTALFGFVK